MANRDLYMILGVPPIASFEEIRKAYRTLSKKYHPDLNPDLKLYSDEKMKELVEAYNILSSQEKRKEYDKQPQFQIRRSRKDPRRKSASGAQDASAFTKKPKYDKEPSLLERILSPFLKSSKKSDNTSHVDYKQADVHFTLGLSMAENEAFYDQAKGEFRLSLKFDPEHKEALYNLGLMCYKLGEFDEARIHFQKYLALDKDDQHARKMLSLIREDF